MIVSDRFSFCFVHIPKCAGSTVRSVLREFDDLYLVNRPLGPDSEQAKRQMHHLPLSVLAENFPSYFKKVQDLTTFAVLRDPSDRFLSCLSEYFRAFRMKEIRDTDLDEIKEIAHWVIEALRNDGPLPRFELSHFTRQVAFVEHEGVQVVDNLYTVSDVKNMLEHISGLVGRPLRDPEREHATVAYRHPALSFVLPHIMKLGKAVVPQRYRKTVARKVHSVTSVPATQVYGDVLKIPEVRDFVAAYYAEDQALYRKVSDLRGPDLAKREEHGT